ncbi:hypothetical protein I6J77_08595 [Rhodanobacter sp. FDAARGOS 1247]|nr:hypothetical protein I6J77_08595 [Rhodanobacter sp. FDAARGOS 1247]
MREPPAHDCIRSLTIHFIHAMPRGENDMLLYAVLIFAVAAIGGLVLASSVLRGKLAPWAISALHALLGASGLVLLILVVLQGAAPGRLTAALALLVLAALGGFFLASFHMRKQVAPKAVVLVHAGVAVVGFLTLLSLLLG